MTPPTLRRLLPALAGTIALGAALTAAPAAERPGGAPRVIALTQTGCQFLEPEGADRGFRPRSAEDYKAVNAETAGERRRAAETLRLKPGRYIFRVTNKNVPYELGFYLRGTGLGRLTLPKVSGGGLTTGKTQDYPVTLRAGAYVFSCPLNPTPDYPLVVKP